MKFQWPWFILLVATPLACGSDATPDTDDDSGQGPGAAARIDLLVDSSLSFEAADAPASFEDAAPRPVEAIEVDGRTLQLIADEVLIDAPSQGELESRASALGGALIDSQQQDDESFSGIVRLPQGAPAPDEVVRLIRSLAEETDDEELNIVRASSPAVLNVIAASARAQELGFDADINWLAEPDTFLDGRTEDNTFANGNTWNAFNRAYFTDGSNQDTGVTTAWDALEREGLLQRTVDVALIDGGFSVGRDIVPNRHFAYSWKSSEAAVGSPNPSGCGGNPCPWHGAGALHTLMGEPDNAYGAAGVAGPVIDELTTIHTGLWLSRQKNALDRVWRQGSFIVSMSFGAELPGFLAWTVSGARKKYERIGQSRVLIASAGNNANNIDRSESGGGVGKILKFPCEFNNVYCVGALEDDSTDIISYSNFSFDHVEGGLRDGTVNIYAPTNIRVAPYPGTPMNELDSFGGTSAATPFVAGVAALIKAAAPQATSNDVVRRLSSSAHRSFNPADSNRIRIDAASAVLSILGNVRPDVTFTTPAAGSAVKEGELVLAVDVTDPDTPSEDLRAYYSTMVGGVQRALGNAPVSESVTVESLCDGEWDIDVVVRPEGPSSMDPSSNVETIAVTITDEGSSGTPPDACRPFIEIAQPLEGAAYPADQRIRLVAMIDDDREDTEDPIYPIDWTLESLAGTKIAQGVDTTAQLSAGSYTLWASYGVEQDFVQFTVIADNEPPSVTMNTPTDNQLFTYPDDTTFEDGNFWLNLILSGVATDPEDGQLFGPSIQWEVRRVGDPSWLDAGSGQLRSYRLRVLNGRNDYQVRMTATDSVGLVDTLTRPFRVQGPPN